MKNRLGLTGGWRFKRPHKIRGGYHAKGFSSRIWLDEESSSTSSTRQRLKRALRKEFEEALA
jgi:hypothetical protein